MGIFHLRCPASGLGIVSEECVLLLVARVEKGRFSPVAPPVRGRYDSYGRLAGIGSGPAPRAILAGAKALAKKSALAAEGGGRLPSLKTSAAFLADVRQGQVDGTWITADGRRVGYVIVLASVFDAVAAESKGRVTTAAILGDPLAARFFGEDGAGLVQLAKFRAGFDALGGSWTPKPIGMQYSGTELRRHAKKALEKFEGRPKLIAAVRAYAESLEPRKPVKGASAAASKLLSLVAKAAGVPSSKVTPTQRLAKDLGLAANSKGALALYEELSEVSDRLGYGHFRGFQTVQDILDFMRKHHPSRFAKP